MTERILTPPMTYTREEAAAAFEWLRAASLVADIHSHHAAIMFTEIARLKAASSEKKENVLSFDPCEKHGTTACMICGLNARLEESAPSATRRIHTCPSCGYPHNPESL